VQKQLLSHLSSATSLPPLIPPAFAKPSECRFVPTLCIAWRKAPSSRVVLSRVHGYKVEEHVLCCIPTYSTALLGGRRLPDVVFARPSALQTTKYTRQYTLVSNQQSFGMSPAQDLSQGVLTQRQHAGNITSPRQLQGGASPRNNSSYSVYQKCGILGAQHCATSS